MYSVSITCATGSKASMLHKMPEVPALEACYTGPPDIVLGAVTCGTCVHSMSSLRGSKLYAGQASGAECAGAL